MTALTSETQEAVQLNGSQALKMQMLRMVAPQGLAIRTEMEIYYLKDSSWNFFMEHWPLERNINTNTP